MKGKNWKKKALAKAIAGVFVCGALSGNVLALESNFEKLVGNDLIIGRLAFTIGTYQGNDAWVFKYDDFNSSPSTFRTSTGRTNINPNQDINFNISFTRNNVAGPFGIGTLIHDTDRTVRLSYTSVSPEFINLRNESNGTILVEQHGNEEIAPTINNYGQISIENISSGHILFTSSGGGISSLI